MQRSHDDDPCGFLLKNSHDWVVLNFPAIALKDEQFPIGDGRFHDRHIDDVLHPERSLIIWTTYVRTWARTSSLPNTNNTQANQPAI